MARCPNAVSAWQITGQAKVCVKVANTADLEPFLVRFGLDVPGRPRTLLETGRLVGRPPTRWSGELEALLRSIRRAAVVEAARDEDAI